jgi:hypothetical protein
MHVPPLRRRLLNRQCILVRLDRFYQLQVFGLVVDEQQDRKSNAIRSIGLNEVIHLGRLFILPSGANF